MRRWPKKHVIVSHNLLYCMVQVSRKSEILDDVDLSREQLKISSGEAVLHANVVKHLTEEAGISGMNKQIEVNLSLVHFLLFYYHTCS